MTTRGVASLQIYFNNPKCRVPDADKAKLSSVAQYLSAQGGPCAFINFIDYLGGSWVL